MECGRSAAWPFLVFTVCLLVGWSVCALGETFYTWTDAQGIVHFADVPPLNTKGVQERKLYAPPSASSESAAPSAAKHAADNDTPPAPATDGPAHVVVTAQKMPRLGPSALRIRGEVKNVGGANAESVAVIVHVADSGQGNPCLQRELSVTPPTLHAGETGKFSEDISSPCLFGTPTVALSPAWECPPT